MLTCVHEYEDCHEHVGVGGEQRVKKKRRKNIHAEAKKRNKKKG